MGQPNPWTTLGQRTDPVRAVGGETAQEAPADCQSKRARSGQLSATTSAAANEFCSRVLGRVTWRVLEYPLMPQVLSTSCMASAVDCRPRLEVEEKVVWAAMQLLMK